MNILNTYMPGVPRQKGATGYFMAVLTTGATGRDHAVYVGIVNCDPCDEKAREKSAWFVAGGGLKMTYEKALAYFPDLAEHEYRL